MGQVADLLMTVNALTKLFVSVHVLELTHNSYYTVKTNPHIEGLSSGIPDLQGKLHHVMQNITDDTSLEKILSFTDLSTLSARMEGTEVLSCLFKGTDHGWCKAYFIRLDNTSEISTVIFAVEDFDIAATRSVEERVRLVEENKKLREQLEALQK